MQMSESLMRAVTRVQNAICDSSEAPPDGRAVLEECWAAISCGVAGLQAALGEEYDEEQVMELANDAYLMIVRAIRPGIDDEHLMN